MIDDYEYGRRDGLREAIDVLRAEMLAAQNVGNAAAAAVHRNYIVLLEQRLEQAKRGER